jgi:hypothetical protein
MPASSIQTPARTWKKRLTRSTLVCALLLPVFYAGAAWWMISGRPSRDQDPLPLLVLVGLSILGAFLITIASIVAVIIDRRSPAAWIAAILSVAESTAAVFIIQALRHLHF